MAEIHQRPERREPIPATVRPEPLPERPETWTREKSSTGDYIGCPESGHLYHIVNHIATAR